MRGLPAAPSWILGQACRSSQLQLRGHRACLRPGALARSFYTTPIRFLATPDATPATSEPLSPDAKISRLSRDVELESNLNHRAKHIPSYLTTSPIRPTVETTVNNLLYNPLPTSTSSRHILQVLVTNEPGVLSRISGLFAARHINIDSLVVSATEVAEISRMTIVIDGNPEIVNQAKAQVEDLIPVWAATEIDERNVVEREMCLVKVNTLPSKVPKDDEAAQSVPPLITTHLQLQAIQNLATVFSGRVVDITHDSCVVSLCAKPKRVGAFLKLLQPFGIIEVAKSGSMVMLRGTLDHIDEMGNDQPEADGEVDPTQLPPG